MVALIDATQEGQPLTLEVLKEMAASAKYTARLTEQVIAGEMTAGNAATMAIDKYPSIPMTKAQLAKEIANTAVMLCLREILGVDR